MGRLPPPPPPRSRAEAEAQIKQLQREIRIIKFRTWTVRIVGAIGLLFVLACIALNHFVGELP